MGELLGHDRDRAYHSETHDPDVVRRRVTTADAVGGRDPRTSLGDECTLIDRTSDPAPRFWGWRDRITTA